MKINHIDLGKHPILLAPMEDVTDPAFRLMCKKFGADMVYTESDIRQRYGNHGGSRKDCGTGTA